METYKGKEVPIVKEAYDSHSKFSIKEYLIQTTGCYIPIESCIGIDGCAECLFQDKHMAIEYLIEKGHITKEEAMDFSLAGEINTVGWLYFIRVTKSPVAKRKG